MLIPRMDFFVNIFLQKSGNFIYIRKFYVKNYLIIKKILLTSRV